MTASERRWLRFPNREETAIQLRAAGLTYEGVIVDESLGGLKVACPVPPPWSAGESIEVLFWGRWEPATVRWSNWRESRTELGLAWCSVPTRHCERRPRLPADGPRT